MCCYLLSPQTSVIFKIEKLRLRESKWLTRFHTSVLVWELGPSFKFAGSLVQYSLSDASWPPILFFPVYLPSTGNWRPSKPGLWLHGHQCRQPRCTDSPGVQAAQVCQPAPYPASCSLVPVFPEAEASSLEIMVSLTRLSTHIWAHCPRSSASRVL